MTTPVSIHTPEGVRAALTFLAYARIERAPWQSQEPVQREPEDAPRITHPDPTQEPIA